MRSRKGIPSLWAVAPLMWGRRQATRTVRVHLIRWMLLSELTSRHLPTICQIVFNNLDSSRPFFPFDFHRPPPPTNPRRAICQTCCRGWSTLPAQCLYPLVSLRLYEYYSYYSTSQSAACIPPLQHAHATCVPRPRISAPEAQVRPCEKLHDVLHEVNITSRALKVLIILLSLSHG